MRKKKEEALASFVWCGAVVHGLHEDGDVCRDGYTAASATEEPKAGSR